LHSPQNNGLKRDHQQLISNFFLPGIVHQKSLKSIMGQTFFTLVCPHQQLTMIEIPQVPIAKYLPLKGSLQKIHRTPQAPNVNIPIAGKAQEVLRTHTDDSVTPMVNAYGF
jgi:hypothetical protein